MDLKSIAHLARLRFSAEELKVFEAQVADILKFVDELKKVDVSGVEPTSHPLALINVFREDKVGAHGHAPLRHDEFLKQAPASRGPFFEVPPIIDAS